VTAPTERPEATVARPDASMTLLREVMERPLDPGYAAAARHPRHRGRVSLSITLVLAVLAGFLLCVSVREIRRPQRESARVTDELRERVQQRSEAVDRRQAANRALQARITAEQDRALGAGGAALGRQVRDLGLLSGQDGAVGPGVRFTVDDAPGAAEAVGSDPREVLEQDGGVVLDADLQIIVNGLWAAGAEAVAVNGQRLTGRSAIRSAGEAVLVDFRPLRRPYVVEAIGPGRMQADFASGAAGPYVQSLRDNHGIQVQAAARDRLVLPGAGRLVLEHAVPVGPDPEADPQPGARRDTRPG
jgi:uncharacterized protein YlxW (UPF0749 family)